MRVILAFFKKNLNFSNFWIRNGLIIVILALVVNHLVDPQNFISGSTYRFPWFSFLISVFLGMVVIATSKLNFNHYEKKYFKDEITSRLLMHFLLSTLGYIIILYLLITFIILNLEDANFNLFGFVSGLSVTLLISVIGIAGLLSPDIYKLHKLTSLEGKLKVAQGGKITLVHYSEIAYLYSEHKTVFIVKSDGATIITDFTLNEIEQEVSQQSFYRANRQTIIHPRSIEEVKSIENGKLTILLKPTLKDKTVSEITISRYKKQGFMDWFENKL